MFNYVIIVIIYERFIIGYLFYDIIHFSKVMITVIYSFISHVIYKKNNFHIRVILTILGACKSPFKSYMNSRSNLFSL